MDELTLAELPEVDVQHGVDQHARFRLDHDCGKHGRVDQHAALEKQVQRPLCAIVVVPANCPRLDLGLGQRLEGVPQRGFLPVPALAYPRGIDMLGHVVCVCVGEEPGQQGRDHGRQDQPSGAGKGAPRNAGEGRIVVSCARLADGADRVDVAGDEEEQGHGAAAADCEPEEGQLEEMWSGFGIWRWRVQPGHQRGAQVAAHDHKRGDAAKALQEPELAAVTQAPW